MKLAGTLTIVIPTCNRSHFLARLLAYYRKVRCPYPVLIGDSSNSQNFLETAKWISQSESSLNLKHVSCPVPPGSSPGKGTIQGLVNLLRRVETPYAVFNADDDFIVPRMIGQCVRFLDEHIDYSAAHGDAILVASGANGHGRRITTCRYRQRSIERETPSLRLLDHLGNCTATEFSVKRTAQMRAHWEAVLALNLDNHFGELLNSCLSVVDGKAKKLPGLYMAREAHRDMTSVRSRDLFDRVTSADFALQYAKFSQYASVYLAKTENLHETEAKMVVKQGVWFYLAAGLQMKWRTRYGIFTPALFARLRRKCRENATFSSLWMKIRSFVPDQKGIFFVPALLRSTSRFYADFCPIYESIVETISTEPNEVYVGKDRTPELQ